MPDAQPTHGPVAGVPAAPLSYREARALIDGRGPGIKPGLGRIEALVDLLDHPERTYPTIQVAGTNGKSSTARMIGAVLAANGLTTGVYTSPHLQSIRECFTLAGLTEEAPLAMDYISPEEFAEVLQYLLAFVQLVETSRGDQVSAFELTTAMAFEWMANHSVSAGVLEAGLGGSWDATNVVAGEVGVLTHIGVDHIALLGASPLENARQKVGIIKPEGRIVSAAQDADVSDLIHATAGTVGATVALIDRDFRLVSNEVGFGGRLISVEGPAGGRYDEVFVPLLGAHQAVNATLAIAAAEELVGRPLEPEAVAAGLLEVRSPGRLEVVSRQPLTVLDGAHNPEAASLLGPDLASVFRGTRRVFVASIFADKDIAGVLSALLPFAASLVVTASSSPRAASAGQLAGIAAEVGFPAGAVHMVEGLPGALARARDLAGDTGMVVVTGSLYAVGEARNLLVGPLD